MNYIYVSILLGMCCFSVSAQEDEPYLDVYPSSGSVTQGGNLDFHISTNQSPLYIKAKKVSNTFTWTDITSGLMAGEYPEPANKPWRADYEWPVAYTFVIPEDWAPGLYHFSVGTETDTNLNLVFQVVIKPETPGSFSRIAVLANEFTNIAYNTTGGKSNYESYVPDDPKRANILSFNKPGSYEYPTRDFYFPRWADHIGMPVEYLTSLELSRDRNALNNYDVLVLNGHSEYWSHPMRKNLERFLNDGGKLISLSGNTMWWSVRALEAGRGLIMVSCKGWKNDPLCSTEPNQVTDGWYKINPELKVLGASFLYGGYVDWKHHYPQSEGYGGYFVTDETNWLWHGTETLNGDQVGQAESIAGYESDSPPMIVDEDGTVSIDTSHPDVPANIELIGVTPASKTRQGETIQGHGAIIYFPYGDKGGAVFNCGSTDCATKLGEDPVWQKAMFNVFSKFQKSHTHHVDTDGDSVFDCEDNCVLTFNPKQADINNNGTGDVCDQLCHP